MQGPPVVRRELRRASRRRHKRPSGFGCAVAMHRNGFVPLRLLNESAGACTYALARSTGRSTCCRGSLIWDRRRWRGVHIHVLAGSDAHWLGCWWPHPDHLDLVCGGEAGRRREQDPCQPTGHEHPPYRNHRPSRWGGTSGCRRDGPNPSRSRHRGTKAYLIALGITSVALSWGLVHTVFTLRYAPTFYSHSLIAASRQ